jgi:hypothetical protein
LFINFIKTIDDRIDSLNNQFQSIVNKKIDISERKGIRSVAGMTEGVSTIGAITSTDLELPDPELENIIAMNDNL